MKRVALVIGVIWMLAACKKSTVQQPDAPHPAMNYINLSDTAISFGRFASFDLDGNGVKDISFSTLLVGDAVNRQDKKQFLVATAQFTYLPVNSEEAIPVMQAADEIPVHNFNGYTWFDISYILLAQKLIGIDKPPYWEGQWKAAAHRFIPLQIKRANALYNGWVEIRFSAAEEKIYLHRAAVCKEAGVTIKAGR